MLRTGEFNDGDGVSVSREAHARGMNAFAVQFDLNPQPASVVLPIAQLGWRSGSFQTPRVEVMVWIPEHYSLDLRSGRGSGPVARDFEAFTHSSYVAAACVKGSIIVGISALVLGGMGSVSSLKGLFG